MVPVTVEVPDAARDPRGSVSNAARAADGGCIGMLAWFAVTPPGACAYTTLPFGTPRATTAVRKNKRIGKISVGDAGPRAPGRCRALLVFIARFAGRQ